MHSLAPSILPVILTATLVGLPAHAKADEPRWLYCEATRADDGVRVSYTFKIDKGIAHAKHGLWEVQETERELRLVYIHEDGRRDEGAVIIIDRVTGELFHNAYNVSIYRTQADDQPCQVTKQRF